MSEQQPQQPAAPVFSIEKIYLKDLSLEIPGAPQVFSERESPKIDVNIHNAARTLSPGIYEVVLTSTVTAKHNDRTAFLVEVKQAGLFVMRNLEEAELKRAISTVCPGVLFPYARCAVSQLVTQGGFPQFLLPPVNFDALYAAQAPGATN